jgi:hypothetical protein
MAWPRLRHADRQPLRPCKAYIDSLAAILRPSEGARIARGSRPQRHQRNAYRPSSTPPRRRNHRAACAVGINAKIENIDRRLDQVFTRDFDLTIVSHRTNDISIYARDDSAFYAARFKALMTAPPPHRPKPTARASCRTRNACCRRRRQRLPLQLPKIGVWNAPARPVGQLPVRRTT